MSTISRFKFISIAGTAAAAFISHPVRGLFRKTKLIDNNMYGLIGSIKAKSGQRDALIKILIDGSAEMPGCLSYVVSKDYSNDDLIWITEVWDSRESHQASLSIPAVQEAISLGRPLIEEFVERIELEPAGGFGLTSI